MTHATLAQRLSARPRRERVDAGAAIGASLAAGAILLTALVALSVVFYDEPAWNIPQMIGATVTGSAPGRMFDPRLAIAGIVLHFTLSALYALAFAGIFAEDMRTPALGAAFGIALYFLNLHGFTQIFPWFAGLRTLDTLACHALFGLLLSHIYSSLADG